MSNGLSTSILDPNISGRGDIRPPASPPGLGRIRARPGFREAALATAGTTVAHFGGHRLLNRALNDRGRFAIGLAVLDMHFGGGTGQPLTVGRLQDFCTRHGLCSRGRARAVLAVLRAMRLVAARPGDDRRVRVLQATPTFLALHRERFARIFAAMEPVSPRMAEAAAALADDRFLAAFARRLLLRFEQGFRILEVTPALRPVAEKAAGLITLMAIYAESGGVAGERRIVLSDYAGRFLVSRGHVLEIVRATEVAGLIRIVGDTGARIDLLPAFAASFEEFFDGMFAIVLDGIEAGLAEIRETT